MLSSQIIFFITLTLATLGLAYELTSKWRERTIVKSDGRKPEFIHRNLKLIGRFTYKNGQIYYHAFCLGPFILAPLGCFHGEGRRSKDVLGKQKSNPVEILALYCRWGWLVSLACFLHWMI